jgi:hypothetical protein
MSKLLERIAQASTKLDKVPPGAKTRQGWEAEWGCRRAAANETLKKGVDAGIMATGKFRVKTAGGSSLVPHYWEVK